jgi:hypothetical protein
VHVVRHDTPPAIRNSHNDDRPSPVDLFLAITQGIGTSLAAGVRAAVAALVVGLLALANVGVDFEGTDFSFLESAWWLALMAVVVVLAFVAARAGAPVPTLLTAAIAAAIGALLFSGSLADDNYESWPGLAAGLACALLAFAAATTFLAGAQARLRARGEEDTATFLSLYADVATGALAALAVLVPPISILALAAAAWAAVAQRRRAERKYEGLRILR